jgi:hypothetical protein
MGRKTRAELMSEAGLVASNDQASSFVRLWLDNWLTRTAKTWSWPMLKGRIGPVSVAAGTGALSVGNGESNINQRLHRLVNGWVFWRGQSNANIRGRAFVRPFDNPDPDVDLSVRDTTRQGYPETVRIYTGLGAGGADPESEVLTMVLDPIPSIPVYLYFDALILPPNIGAAAADDTVRPWYPNDRTLVDACKCAIMELDKGDEDDAAYDKAMTALGLKVVEDRDFDGQQAGDNEWLSLDPAQFR